MDKTEMVGIVMDGTRRKMCERREVYANRGKEQEKDEQRGIEQTEGEGEKKEKNRLGKQQIEMEGGEQ